MTSKAEAQRLRFLELAQAARRFVDEFRDDPFVVRELIRCATRCETLAELDALRLAEVEQWDGEGMPWPRQKTPADR
jgi:hypothetical protein